MNNLPKDQISHAIWISTADPLYEPIIGIWQEQFDALDTIEKARILDKLNLWIKEQAEKLDL